jgi:four helix bundle protein
MMSAGRVASCVDMVAWHEARAVPLAVSVATRQGVLALDDGFAGQMQRAAVSIVSSIAEGFERHRS